MKGRIQRNNSTAGVLYCNICNSPGNAVLSTYNDLITLLDSKGQEPGRDFLNLLFSFLVCKGNLLWRILLPTSIIRVSHCVDMKELLDCRPLSTELFSSISIELIPWCKIIFCFHFVLLFDILPKNCQFCHQ